MQDIFSEAFRRVHANNMTKFPNGKVLRNLEGKIIKPEGFVPVDLSDLI
jgi:predicted HAD superfamily Cof-like phosphohydrolase